MKSLRKGKNNLMKGYAQLILVRILTAWPPLESYNVNSLWHLLKMLG